MSYSLPPLVHKFTDRNGKPFAGGKLWTFRAGTTTPRATYIDSTNTTPNSNPIILDANGECDIFAATGANFKFRLEDADGALIWVKDGISIPAGGGGGGGGLPEGGLAGAILAKVSDDDQDADWDPFAFAGFSSKLNRVVNFANLREIMVDYLGITYTAPQISLSASGNSLREKGTAVTSTTLTASIVKKSDPLATVRFYLNPSTLLSTQTSGGAIPAGGNSTYAWTGSFADNTTFRAEVDDNGATGGPTTVPSTTTFSYVYPYYYGAGAQAKTAAQIRADLTHDIISSSNNLTRSYTFTSGQTAYFAYPAAYGDLTQIFDENNFDVTAGWTKTTKSITGLDGNAVNYTSYEKTVPFGVSGTTTFKFVR